MLELVLSGAGRAGTNPYLFNYKKKAIDHACSIAVTMSKPCLLNYERVCLIIN